MITLKRRLAAAALLAAMLLALPAGGTAKAAAPFRDLVASAAILCEADSGMVLFERNMNVRHPADGLAKIMMLLIAAEACSEYEADPRRRVEMSGTAWDNISANSATIGISPGEEMPLLDLMYCAFVGGASEACNMVAEHIAGSVDAFVRKMNARAREIGCTNTNFSNANGQYSPSQYTTAQDQFYILREALSNPMFVEISGTYRYAVGETNMTDSRNLTSSNSMLNTSGKYYYGPCSSGVASATYEGGYSFAAFAEADGMALISVVLGSDIIILDDESTQMRNLTESRRLLEWGFSEFSWRTILSSSDLIAKAPIENGAGADFVNLRPETSIQLLLDNDIPLDSFVRTVKIYSVENDEPLVAPVSAGDVLGEVTLTRNNVRYGPVKLVANTNVELHRLVFIKMRILEVLAGKTARIVIVSLIALVAIYVGLVVRYNIIRRKRIRRIKAAKKKLVDGRHSGTWDDE